MIKKDVLDEIINDKKDYHKEVIKDLNKLEIKEEKKDGSLEDPIEKFEKFWDFETYLNSLQFTS